MTSIKNSTWQQIATALDAPRTVLRNRHVDEWQRTTALSPPSHQAVYQWAHDRWGRSQLTNAPKKEDHEQENRGRSARGHHDDHACIRSRCRQLFQYAHSDSPQNHQNVGEG